VQHHPVRRRLAAALALLVAASGLALAVTSGPAVAGSGDDGEGGSKSLTDQLDAASSGYLKAKAALATSKKAQTDLTAELKQIDAQIAPQQAALDTIVRQAYMTGRLGPMAALLTADSSQGMLDRVETLQTVAYKQETAISDLTATKTKQQEAKIAIDAAVRDQQKQVNLMARKKADAEAALKKANTGGDATSPGGTISHSLTAPKYTGPQGDSCTVNDPTSGGCITARMLNAMQQAQGAGFTHYVHCWREQDSGEHPKGRACDFAADKTDFGGVATGASKTYGNNLANYFIHNSDNLQVLYVIWFERIWLPSSGWKAYTLGNGDPSSDHTNHVHLSVE
jgi:hypothetical protein